VSNTIYVVGLGPGDKKLETVYADEVLTKCEVIVGYTVYVELVKARFPKKEYVTTPMTKEIERCRMCYEIAAKGRDVALVCSGDAGVYGMASPMYELLPVYEDTGVELEIVTGITAANSGAGILGAPLNNDYCVMSLSDLLTPWDKIEARIRAAVAGDFAMAIYNPSSKKRADYLKKAIDIMLDSGISPNTACGFVKNIGRENQESRVMLLSELRETQVDMFTTVFIGNTQTVIIGDKLVTKRGYRH